MKSAEKPSTMAAAWKPSKSLLGTSAPRNSKLSVTSTIAEASIPTTMSGFAASVSPGTVNRERQCSSAASSTSVETASSMSRPFARCATAEPMTTITAICQARRRRRASERDSQMSAIPNASAKTRAAFGTPGGSTPRTRS